MFGDMAVQEVITEGCVKLCFSDLTIPLSYVAFPLLKFAAAELEPLSLTMPATLSISSCRLSMEYRMSWCCREQ